MDAASQIKPPQMKSPMVMKIMQALSQDLKPGTVPYFQFLNMEASQRGIIPSANLGPLAGIRDAFSSDVQSLIKEQELATKIGLQMLGGQAESQLAEERALRFAPQTAREANAINPGILPQLNYAPPQMTVTEAGLEGTPMPFDVDAVLRPAPGSHPPGQAAMAREFAPLGQKNLYQPAPPDDRFIESVWQQPNLDAPLPDMVRLNFAKAADKLAADVAAEMSPEDIASAEDWRRAMLAERQPSAMPAPSGAMPLDANGELSIPSVGVQPPPLPKRGLRPNVYLGLVKEATKANTDKADATQVLETVDADGKPIRVLINKRTGEIVNPNLPSPAPNTKQMATQLESAAAVYSKEHHGRVMTFAELASIDPAGAKQVRRQAEIDEPKEIYSFQQGEQMKRRIAEAPIIAEETEKAKEAVKSDIRLSGPTMIMDTLTNLTPQLFVPEKAGRLARGQHAINLRNQLADASSSITTWQRSIATAMRPQLARAEGEVGNLAAQEQLNAGELIPDPLGGFTDTFPFVKLPDTLETARDRLKLATEFLEISSEAPKGRRDDSAVQQKIRSIKQRLDKINERTADAYLKEAGAADVGELTPDEFEYAKQMKAAGKSKAEVAALILRMRGK